VGVTRAWITETDFGDAWPFTVARGLLQCTGSNGYGPVTFYSGGIQYALNDAAIVDGAGTRVDPILADDPDIPASKKDIQPVIERGLELCA
jgi:hypothetical protein